MKVIGMRDRCMVMARSFTLMVILIKANLKLTNVTDTVHLFKSLVKFTKVTGFKIDLTERANSNS